MFTLNEVKKYNNTWKKYAESEKLDEKNLYYMRRIYKIFCININLSSLQI